MRVAGQQRLATAGAVTRYRPGVAAFELRDTGVAQCLMTEAGEGFKAVPVGGGQRRAQSTLGLPA